MPFGCPPATFAHAGFVGSWTTQPCCGESASGDSLFREDGRADSGELFLLIDVMGHGVAASQTVELLERQLLPDPCCQDLSPADLLRVLHGMLQSEWAATGRFVTALALLIDGTQGRVTGGNAALPEPLTGRVGGAWQPWSVPGGVLLGLPVPDVDYAEEVRSLGTGECLLSFTDGVSEAGAPRGHQFQHGPLQAFLASLPAGLAIDEVVDRLRQALQAHVGAGWPEDDTTVLGLERT